MNDRVATGQLEKEEVDEFRVLDSIKETLEAEMMSLSYLEEISEEHDRRADLLDALSIEDLCKQIPTKAIVLYTSLSDDGLAVFAVTTNGVEQSFWNAVDVSLILGGSGVTPGYQVIARILKNKDDKTKIKVIDANKAEGDILMSGDFDEFSKNHKDQFEIVHVLSHPGDDWKGLKGHVNEDIIKKHAFEPGEKNVALLCGPPTMIQKAALPALKDWGYEEDKNLFGF